jgi:hypothetical protein
MCSLTGPIVRIPGEAFRKRNRFGVKVPSDFFLFSQFFTFKPAGSSLFPDYPDFTVRWAWLPLLGPRHDFPAISLSGAGKADGGQAPYVGLSRIRTALICTGGHPLRNFRLTLTLPGAIRLRDAGRVPLPRAFAHP